MVKIEIIQPSEIIYTMFPSEKLMFDADTVPGQWPLLALYIEEFHL